MIKIICIGKIKESYLRDAINDYKKRLSKYTSLKIIELDDENLNDGERSLIREANNIIKYVDNSDYVITTEVDGESISSIQLSNKIQKLFVDGKSNITFIIGGSNGLSEIIKKRADYKLSFSKLTFPHQLFRVILLEQLYRSFKIISNESYHK